MRSWSGANLSRDELVAARRAWQVARRATSVGQWRQRLDRGRGVGERRPVRSRELAEVEGTRLRRALLGRVIDVQQPEALRESVRPLDVVEERPREVAAHVDPLGDRLA